MASAERSRVMLAELLGVPVGTIALGSTVSELVALLAAALPAGSRVLTATGDFTSLLFPWAVQSARGIETIEVPLSELADRIDAQTSAVAVSLVQSGNGSMLEVEELLDAAAAHDVLTVVDVTQAAGWLPVNASRFDAVVGAAYKWLMAPRGTAYLYVKEERWPSLLPLHAGWCAGPDPAETYYGLPLRLADTARRFDTSPAWFSWVGAAPALELLLELGIAAIREHNVALARRFSAGIGVDPSDSAIVAVSGRLRGHSTDVRVSSRGGQLRASFHLYNDEHDVDALVAALECA